MSELKVPKKYEIFRSFNTAPIYEFYYVLLCSDDKDTHHMSRNLLRQIFDLGLSFKQFKYLRSSCDAFLHVGGEG